MTTEFKNDEKVTTDLKPPRMWKVIFLNDDVTPMDLVIDILTRVFKHDSTSAKNITMEVHNNGSAVAGVYMYEIAEQKGLEATSIARSNGSPLCIQVEEE